MRNLFFLILLSGLIAASCKGKSKNTITIKDEDGKTTGTIDVSDMPKTASAANELEKKMEELKKLTPLSLDQLKAMLPEEFMGMKRSNFSANSMMGTGSCNATYKGNDDKELKISIIDCAGEAGAGLYSLRFWSLMNFQQEDDDGYSKTIDFNGQKAVESYKKNNDEYSLMYTASDRLLVHLEGEKTGLEALKQAASNLNLKVN